MVFAASIPCSLLAEMIAPNKVFVVERGECCEASHFMTIICNASQVIELELHYHMQYMKIPSNALHVMNIPTMKRVKSCQDALGRQCGECHDMS